MDSKIPIESSKQILCEVFSRVLGIGRAKSFSELMKSGLGNECQGSTGVTDVEIKGAGAAPFHGLFEVEEFFDMPTLGEFSG
ncbi:MAG: hypothetical protein DRG35_03885 [Deltaproteobacteria bacterium]|nr:MAG: hypothetical protein DRG35_03885 [Deltaproteobacteria bacterium]RLB22047.1 MAG: hypothetical protein DRG73_07530 [Deltaproteobacteria bacterium]